MTSIEKKLDIILKKVNALTSGVKIVDLDDYNGEPGAYFYASTNYGGGKDRKVDLNDLLQRISNIEQILTNNNLT